MKKRLLLVFLATLFFASILAGCSKDTSGDQDVVTIWSWRSQDEDLWMLVQEELNKQEKDITIDFRSVEATQYNAVLQTAMNGGEGPDILTLRAGGQIQDYGEANQIEPLNDIVSNINEFLDGTLAQVSSGDDIYAVPFAVQTSQFYYNKKLFDEHGLTEPKTWDDLIKIMETLSTKGVTPMGISGREGWAVNLIIDSMGASLLDPTWVEGLTNGENKYSDQEFVDILDRLNNIKGYFQNGFMAAGYTDMQTLLMQEQVAMIVDGVWAESALREQNPDVELGTFMTPPVTAADQPRIYSFLDGGYGLNANAENRELALEVLNFTATLDFGQIYSDLHGEISAFPGVNPTNPSPLLELAIDRFANNSIDHLFRIRSVYDTGETKISTLLEAGIQDMLGNDKDPQEVANSIQKDIETAHNFK
ncbi:ABC transporter substrate-binding protein [Sutcliffiella cohnii]